MTPLGSKSRTCAAIFESTLDGSKALQELGLAGTGVTTVAAIITGRGLGDNFAPTIKLDVLKLDATGTTGIHRSTGNKDVLLVGGSKGKGLPVSA